jgi:hypothetical protein
MLVFVSQSATTGTNSGGERWKGKKQESKDKKRV